MLSFDNRGYGTEASLCPLGWCVVQVQKEAIQSVEQDGMVFIDEIDKIVVNHDSRYGRTWFQLLHISFSAIVLQALKSRQTLTASNSLACVACVCVWPSVCLSIKLRSEGGALAAPLAQLVLLPGLLPPTAPPPPSPLPSRSLSQCEVAWEQVMQVDVLAAKLRLLLVFICIRKTGSRAQQHCTGCVDCFDMAHTCQKQTSQEMN